MGDDGEIEVAGRNAVRQHRGRLAHHRHFDPRIGIREARQDLGQVAVGVIVRQSQPHMAGEFEIREARHRLAVQPDDAPRIIGQSGPIVGQLGGAAVAREDRPPDALLELLHLHGDGGLRLVHRLGRAGERPGVGDGHEGAELVHVQKGGHADPRS